MNAARTVSVQVIRRFHTSPERVFDAGRPGRLDGLAKLG